MLPELRPVRRRVCGLSAQGGLQNALKWVAGRSAVWPLPVRPPIMLALGWSLRWDGGCCVSHKDLGSADPSVRLT